MLSCLSLENLVELAYSDATLFHPAAPFIMSHAYADMGDAEPQAPPIHWAVSKNSTRLVSYLVSLGHSLDTPDEDNNTPVRHALLARHTSMVMHLLSLGANVNPPRRGVGSLLHYASSQGEFDICEALIRGGVDVNEHDTCGRTPLDWVVEHSQIGVVDLLLDNGATIDHVTPQGSVLHIALSRVPEGQPSLEMLERLLISGAPYTARNAAGVLPMGLAVRRYDIKVIRLLVSFGAGLHMEDIYGNGELTEEEAVLIVTQAIEECRTARVDEGRNSFPARRVVTQGESSRQLPVLRSVAQSVEHEYNNGGRDRGAIPGRRLIGPHHNSGHLGVLNTEPAMPNHPRGEGEVRVGPTMEIYQSAGYEYGDHDSGRGVGVTPARRLIDRHTSDRQGRLDALAVGLRRSRIPPPTVWALSAPYHRMHSQGNNTASHNAWPQSFSQALPESERDRSRAGTGGRPAEGPLTWWT
jgi:hypothetical protein